MFEAIDVFNIDSNELIKVETREEVPDGSYFLMSENVCGEVALLTKTGKDALIAQYVISDDDFIDPRNFIDEVKKHTKKNKVYVIPLPTEILVGLFREDAEKDQDEY